MPARRNAVSSRPATVAVPAGTEVAIVANVTLTPTATRLPDLVTKAASNPRLVDFERRRRSGFGTFLGPEEVAAKGAMPERSAAEIEAALAVEKIEPWNPDDE